MANAMNLGDGSPGGSSEVAPAASSAPAPAPAAAPVPTETGAPPAPAQEQAPVVEQQQPSQALEQQPPSYQLPEDDSDLEGRQGVDEVRQLRQMAREYQTQRSTYEETLQHAQPLLERVEKWGSEEALNNGMDLVEQLFQYETDDQGNVLRDSNGMGIPNPQAFVENLASFHLPALMRVLDYGLGMTLPSGERAVDVFMRDALGIVPELLPQLQQIRSLEDFHNVLDEVDQEDLTEIPQQYHDAYRSLSERERIRLQGLDDDTRNLVLKAQNAELYQKRQEEANAQKDREYAQQQAQEAERNIYQAGDQLAMSVRDMHFNSLRQEASKITYHADPKTNDLITTAILNASANYVDTDPATLPLLGQANELYHQAEMLKAKGYGFDAAGVRRQADMLAMQAAQKGRLYMQTLQKAITGQTIQNGEAPTSRAVIPSSGESALKQERANYAPFSPESMADHERRLAMLQKNGGGSPPPFR